MVILRPTRKLRSALPTLAESRQSDTALGDSYVNRVVVQRQPLLLLVSATSLLPMVLPARAVRRLPDRLAAIVDARLRRCGIEAHAIAREIEAMHPVVLAPTVDRSVLGIMVDFAHGIPYYFEPRREAAEALVLVEDRLAETPCHASRPGDGCVFPNKKARELLRAKWLSN